MFDMRKIHQEQQERAAHAKAEAAHKAAQPKADAPKKMAFYQGKPEPKYDIVVDAAGNSRKVEAEQSPFPLDLVKQIGRGSETLRSLQIHRQDDLQSHKRFMLREKGPQLEAKHGLKASEVFGPNGSREATRLMGESPDDYYWLREFHRLTN